MPPSLPKVGRPITSTGALREKPKWKDYLQSATQLRREGLNADRRYKRWPAFVKKVGELWRSGFDQGYTKDELSEELHKTKQQPKDPLASIAISFRSVTTKKRCTPASIRRTLLDYGIDTPDRYMFHDEPRRKLLEHFEKNKQRVSDRLRAPERVERRKSKRIASYSPEG